MYQKSNLLSYADKYNENMETDNKKALTLKPVSFNNSKGSEHELHNYIYQIIIAINLKQL